VAARFDVAARLTEGVEAVEEIQTYVEACRMRGYQHADLTVTRIRDCYTAEEGLDLRVLDADCATLRGIAADAAEALRSARSSGGALADAWAGQGGAAAAEFVRRHCNTAEILVEALRTAAEAGAVLRDELWRVVDRRVAQTQEIVDRARAQQPVWLAAAHAVLAGGQADDEAVRTVDGQVKPFVDNVIGVEWVSAMRLADGDATAAFRVAVDGAGAGASLRFDVPGDLGPRHSVPRGATRAAADAATAPLQVRPAAAPLTGEWRPAAADAAVPATAPPPTPMPAAPPVAAPPLPNPLDALASVPAVPPSGGLPGLGTAGVPDLGGTHAMPGRLAEALSGLTDPPALPDVDAPDELAPGDEPEGPDEPGVDEEEGSADGDDAETDELAVDEPESSNAEDGDGGAVAAPDGPGCPDAAPAAPAESAPLPEQPAPTPVAESAPVADPPTPAPADAAGTPCEIAADELPQAGQ
jgi:hypothetical protein